MKPFSIFAVICLLLLSVMMKAQVGSMSGDKTFCDSINTGFVTYNGTPGSVQFWQQSTNNGPWINISNPGVTQSYNNLKQTTRFRVVVNPPDTSASATITVYKAAVGGTITSIYPNNNCSASGNGQLTLTGLVGNVQYWEVSTNFGNTWSIIANTSTINPYLTTTITKQFRAVVQNVAVCPTDTSSAYTIYVSPNTNAGTVLKTDTVCKGFNHDTLKITGSVGAIQYWLSSTNNGSSWTTITNTTNKLIFNNIAQTTWYRAIVKSGVCPADSSVKAIITTKNAALANAGSDKTINLFESVSLDGSGNGFPVWNANSTLSDTTIFAPIATPSTTTVYVLTLHDALSCSTKDTVVVTVIIPIPSCITPNGDGANDFFHIDKIENFGSSKLHIISKWGNVVYKASPYNNDWSGKSISGGDLPDDTYFYVLDYGNGDKPITGYIVIKR